MALANLASSSPSRVEATSSSTGRLRSSDGGSGRRSYRTVRFHGAEKSNRGMGVAGGGRAIMVSPLIGCRRPCSKVTSPPHFSDHLVTKNPTILFLPPETRPKSNSLPKAKTFLFFQAQTKSAIPFYSIFPRKTYRQHIQNTLNGGPGRRASRRSAGNNCDARPSSTSTSWKQSRTWRPRSQMDTEVEDEERRRLLLSRTP